MVKNILVSILLGSFLIACASKEAKEQPKAAVEERTLSKESNEAATTKPVEEQAVSGNPLTDPKNILSKRSVYFDYDGYVVKDEFKPLVQAHAKYLTQNRGTKTTLQGNTDERGSREYNLALGQRRADSVKKMMVLLGAQDNQIEAVSFGEEKPKATSANETAWAENRRVDIVYSGE